MDPQHWSIKYIKKSKKSLCLKRYLYRSIMSMLLDDNVKAISTGIISQLDLDLCQCETFAVSEPVPGLGKGSPPSRAGI
jgi:hypothetical protein